MPKLENVTLAPTGMDPIKVARVSRALGIGGTTNDVTALGFAVRHWFKDDPAKRAAFIAWFEAQP